MSDTVMILIGSIFVNNFVLTRFLGICPFIGVSGKRQTAVGMGLAVTFVMTISCLMTWLVEKLLGAFGLLHLRVIAYILIIAVLVQAIEMLIRKFSPALHRALGVYLPLITTNCAVLGAALLAQRASYGLLDTVATGLGGGLGFLLAIVLFSSIREQMQSRGLPSWMEGFPGALIAAGLMSLAFSGFAGLIG